MKTLVNSQLIEGESADQWDGRPWPSAMTRAEIMPWLVRFAQTDVDQLWRGRPGDVINLVYELARWLDVRPDDPDATEIRNLKDKPDQLKKLVEGIRKLLHAVVDKQRFETNYEGGKIILDAGKLGKLGRRALSYLDSKLEDAVVRVALDDICENPEAALRIKRCKNQRCNSIFFAGRKNQIYCSHRCANYVASQQYRERHQDKRAAQASRRYERKVKESTSPHIKVGRKK